MATIVDHIEFGRTTIAYEVVRRRQRETVAITVNPDTTVTVLAPSGVQRQRIRRVVASRADWIVEKQDQASRHIAPQSQKIVSGKAIPYLGRDYQLKLMFMTDDDTKPSLRVERGQFVIAVGRRWSTNRKKEAARGILVEWYRERALRRITHTAGEYGRRLGVTYKSLQIYEMRARWGSGGTSGRLRFNWRIVMAPRRMVDYVIAHELCHLRYDHHSPAFWRMLTMVMPDYEQRRIELAHIGPRLDL